jgi:glutaredoxin-like protein NrdH
MTDIIVVWTKPSCVQCDAVKRRLLTAFLGLDAPSKAQVNEFWHELEEQGFARTMDLTHPDNAKDLDYFKGLGFASAPVTEYKGQIMAGYDPAKLDEMIGAWDSDNPDPRRG